MVLPRALDEIKASEAGFYLDHKAAPVEWFACEHGKKLSHMTLSKQSPTDPIEGRTLDFVATSAKGGGVQWLIWSERSTVGAAAAPAPCRAF